MRINPDNQHPGTEPVSAATAGRLLFGADGRLCAEDRVLAFVAADRRTDTLCRLVADDVEAAIVTPAGAPGWRFDLLDDSGRRTGGSAASSPAPWRAVARGGADARAAGQLVEPRPVVVRDARRRSRRGNREVPRRAARRRLGRLRDRARGRARGFCAGAIGASAGARVRLLADRPMARARAGRSHAHVGRPRRRARGSAARDRWERDRRARVERGEVRKDRLSRRPRWR